MPSRRLVQLVPAKNAYCLCKMVPPQYFIIVRRISRWGRAKNVNLYFEAFVWVKLYHCHTRMCAENKRCYRFRALRVAVNFIATSISHFSLLMVFSVLLFVVLERRWWCWWICVFVCPRSWMQEMWTSTRIEPETSEMRFLGTPLPPKIN